MLLFHFHQEVLQFLFDLRHKGGVICVSEVIDISPSNFDPSFLKEAAKVPLKSENMGTHFMTSMSSRNKQNI